MSLSETHISKDDIPEIDFTKTKFPSDALSIGRLRKTFPGKFDGGKGRIADGFEDVVFFERYSKGFRKRMEDLTQMLEDERIVAEYSFYEEIKKTRPDLITEDVLGDEEHLVYKDLAMPQLERHYQYFRLADSPETARFLIEQIRDEGIEQAKALISRSK